MHTLDAVERNRLDALRAAWIAYVDVLAIFVSVEQRAEVDCWCRENMSVFDLSRYSITFWHNGSVVLGMGFLRRADAILFRLAWSEIICGED